MPRNADTSSTVHKRFAGFVVLIACSLSRGLISSCRKIWIGWWTGRGELGGGVFGVPSLSFGHGAQQQHRPGWYIGVSRCGAFPPVGPAIYAVGGLDAGGFEELPNKCAAFGAVVVE